jgi:hypothetical protein
MIWLYYLNSIYKKIDSYDFIKKICFIQTNVSVWKKLKIVEKSLSFER